MSGRNRSRRVKGKVETKPKQARKQRRARKGGNSSVMGPGENVDLSSVMTTKQAKNDPRTQKSGEQALSLTNQTNAVTVTVPLAINQLANIALAYVSKAFEKGFNANDNSPNAAVNAWGYIVDVLVAYATGGVPMATQLPLWMRCLGDMLSPKTVPFEQGRISYAFTLDNTNFVPRPEGIFDIGFQSYGYEWCFGYPNPTGTVDGFPILNAPSYTKGDTNSFQSLIQFMAQNVGDPRRAKQSQLVPLSFQTKWKNDVSIYSVTTQQEGLGSGNVGGWAAEAQLEVPIFAPLLSVVTTGITNPLTGFANRFYNRCTQAAGDAIFVGNALCAYYPMQQWKSVRKPKFHAIDFNEFADVLAQWVAGVVQAYINDPEVQTMVNTNIPGNRNMALTPGIVCPLTLQEMMLLLRNVMMSAFKDTQAGVQSLYPRLPGATNDPFGFVPFTTGAGTCCIASTDMKLPAILIENIRALVCRHVAHTPRDVQQWIGVVGEYFDDRLVADDYVVTDPETHIETLVFQTDPQIQEMVFDPKTNKVMAKSLVEVEISLVDGGTGVNFVAINDNNRLKALTALWNTWISVNNLAQYSSQLSTFSTELGISSLTSITMTRHWLVTPQSAQLNDARFVDKRLVKARLLSNANYGQRMAIATTSYSVILNAPYEQVQSWWILPTNYLHSGPTFASQTLLQRTQELSGEPYCATTSSGATGMVLSEIHSTYASKMLRARNAPLSDTDNFIAEQAAAGRGGILSAIGAALDGAIGF